MDLKKFEKNKERIVRGNSESLKTVDQVDEKGKKLK